MGLLSTIGLVATVVGAGAGVVGYMADKKEQKETIHNEVIAEFDRRFAEIDSDEESEEE